METEETYRKSINSSLASSSAGEYLHYDEAGDLWLNEFKIADLVKKYGTPFEICDMRIMEKRAKDWRERTNKIADEVGFKGGFDYYYASKANMSFEFTTTAYAAGWNAETSSAQDVEHLLWLYRNGHITKDLKVLSNGFKNNVAYTSAILALHSLDFSITPILDSGELEYFTSLSVKRPLSVGLRMKFGLVHNDAELSQFSSRHGMEWNELVGVADQISHSSNMELTTILAMIGTFESDKVEEYAEAFLFGIDKYFRLKKLHSSLKYFDIGGGVPPQNTGFDHDQFLKLFLRGIQRKAEEYGLEPPVLTFELGSYLADEASMLVHGIVERKNNSSDAHGESEEWVIVDGGLMAELPDMMFIQKKFMVLAGNGIDAEVRKVVLGDLTCDSDGRYPTRMMDPDTIDFPKSEATTFLVITPTGAYQRVLAGAGGAHHCGILNPGRLFIQKQDNEVVMRFTPQQSVEQYKELMGYSNKSTIGSAKTNWKAALKALIPANTNK